MKRSCVFIAGMAMAVILAHKSSGQSANLHITSTAFKAGGTIPEQFSCKGANYNPPLAFEGVPDKAVSLALIVDDPDAPGGTFTHWLAWNIDAKTKQIAQSSVPSGAVQGENDFGKPGYGGPCPPSGVHRYYFRLFALDRKLDLRSGAKRAAVDRALAGHILASGTLMGRFGR
jgi:Raf kinase inhibitor-like YbhB/YbcL family protein